MLLEGCQPPNNKPKEKEWTICFHFPNEDLYPSKFSGYQKSLDENVLIWDKKSEAKEFAEDHAGKYGFSIIPTVIEMIQY